MLAYLGQESTFQAKVLYSSLSNPTFRCSEFGPSQNQMGQVDIKTVVSAT